METVWKCDFCMHTKPEGDEEGMRAHEKSCSFNPQNKQCYTCPHSSASQWSEGGAIDVCAKEHKTTFMWDVLDGDKECPDWAAGQ